MKDWSKDFFSLLITPATFDEIFLTAQKLIKTFAKGFFRKPIK